MTLAAPAILTLAEGVEASTLLSIVSALVGLAAILQTILSRLAGRAEKARDRLAESRHGELCGKIELAHERVTETKKTVEGFRDESRREFAALHAADARLALDLERRVGPIEGKLGIGRVAERSGKAVV